MTPISILARRCADMEQAIEQAAEHGSRGEERQLYREARQLEIAIAAAPADTLNDVGLKLGLLCDGSLCGGIRRGVQPHHHQAIGTAIALILRAQGVISDWGRKSIEMDALSTHRGPEGECPQ